MTTAIYARISKDADLRGLGVARQIGDCEGLAGRRGWGDLEQYVDNDVSASSTKPRPEYQRLLADIRAGKVTALAVWDIDRLTRKPAELEEIITLADAYGLQLGSVGGEVDLGTPQGRLTARIKGAVARHEVEQASRRIRRKVEELAAAGLPFGGGLRPFGYTVSRLEVVEEEAALIREAAARVLSGDTVRSVVRDWNRRGIVTVTGKAWSHQSLKNVLKAPRTAGLVEHKGAVVGPAKWPAILDMETHEALRYLLLDPTRDPNGDAEIPRVRRWWWSGMVFCQRCDGRMGASGGAARVTWRCLVDYGGCGRTSIEHKHLEPLLTRMVVSHASHVAVGRSGAVAVEDRGATLDAAIAGAESRLEALSTAYAEDDSMSAADYGSATRKLRERLVDLAAQKESLAEVARKVDRARPDAAALAADFEALDVEQRQTVARLVVERFTVGPGTAGRFDEGRVVAQWRLGAPAAVE